MTIEKCYKYKKDDIVYVGGNVPEGAEILEEMNILCAQEGYDLIRKSDRENVGSSILMTVDDIMDNYEEVEHKEQIYHPVSE